MDTLFVAMGVILCNIYCTCASTDADRTLNQGEDNVKINGSDNAWSCSEKWIPYVDNDEISCLWIEKKTRNHAAATEYCQSLGGGLVIFGTSSKETFLKTLVQSKTGESDDYWLGLSKERGYDMELQWQSWSSRTLPSTDNITERLKDFLAYYKAQCGYISSNNEDLSMDECENEYFAICEKDIFCRAGTFGNKCERECHCSGKPCNPDDFYGAHGVTCQWGCQRNWVGVACDKEKQDPEVKYFCINSPEEDGKYVYIRVNTKVLYRAIYGLTASKLRGNWCNSTIIDSSDDSDFLTTIKIPLNKDSIQQMKDGQCVGAVVDDNIFSWEIVVNENEGILLEHDVVISITCDFSVAEKLIRSDQYTIEGEPGHVNHATLIAESIENDVVLNIVDAYSGKSVTEASIGSTVVLQMKYAIQTGSVLKGVFPYNCNAFSGDGRVVKQLLNKNGCPVPGSPLRPFTMVGKDLIATPWFNLFAFEDEQTVTFQCSFGLCFKPDCNVGCRKPSKVRRDAQVKKDEVEHSSTRTIRVLPSISVHKSSGDSPSSEYQPGPAPGAADYEIGPFIYLNPVTCTLFLLILLIFICMYLSFLRTLRKSIYDIRKEIQIKRSRDKFLHCGCTQQMDREQVCP